MDKSYVNRVFVLSDWKVPGGANVVVDAILNYLVKHRQNIVHCYIHQGNIMIEENGTTRSIGRVNAKLPLIWPVQQNRAVAKILRKPDKVISTNGITYGLTGHSADLCYLLFSRVSGYKQQVKLAKGIHRWYRLIAVILYKWIEKRQKPAILVGMTHFTLENARHMQSTNEVLYPPVKPLFVADGSQKDKHLVISIGRFSEEKDQLMQLRIASKVSKLRFILIGFANETSAYYQEVKKQATSLPNVHLVPNAQPDQIANYLKQAALYLHTMVGEHFGITILQAAIAGCLPIIHKEGGAQEMLRVPFITWQREQDIVDILQNNTIQSVLPAQHLIQRMINDLSEDMFEQQFDRLFKLALN